MTDVNHCKTAGMNQTATLVPSSFDLLNHLASLSDLEHNKLELENPFSKRNARGELDSRKRRGALKPFLMADDRRHVGPSTTDMEPTSEDGAGPQQSYRQIYNSRVLG